jgi:hypothetical protein
VQNQETFGAIEKSFINIGDYLAAPLGQILIQNLS